MDLNKWDFQFLKVTEEAAKSVSKWIGQGNEHQADKAATEAMRQAFNEIKIGGEVVIGEGEMDEAPMLYIGERLGTGEIEVDIAVDPIEGTSLVASGKGGAISIIAVAPKGTLLHAPDMYMLKMVVGPRARGTIEIEDSLEQNIYRLATHLQKEVSELRIMIQDRKRHTEIISTLENLGVEVVTFVENDILAALATCVESANIDMLINIGGAPEGVISAAAIKALGGEMQAKLMPTNETEIKRCREMGIDNPHKVLTIDDLAQSDQNIICTTSITSNFLMEGMKREKQSLILNSLVISKGQLRFIKTVNK